MSTCTQAPPCCDLSDLNAQPFKAFWGGVAVYFTVGHELKAYAPLSWGDNPAQELAKWLDCYEQMRQVIGHERIVEMAMFAQDLHHPRAHLGVCAEDSRDPEDRADGPEVDCVDPCYAWVSLYRVTRCCGGPEEGGWWFNWREHVESRRVLRHPRSLAFAERHVQREADGLSYGDIYSSQGGTEYQVRIEDQPGEHASQSRPRYC